MEYGGRPYDPTVPGGYERYRDNPTGDAPIGGVQDDGGFDPVEDYVAWAEENGHITPSASSVVASYIVEDPKREAYKVMIADAFGMAVSEITREVKRQQSESSITMGESKKRITNRQLRRLIREALDFVNRETGEVIDFGEDSLSGVPDAAVPDLSRRLGIDLSQEELSPEDWQKLDDEVLGKQEDREVKRRIKKMKADSARLDIDNLLSRLRDWAVMAADDFEADNPDTNIQDVAYDLADAAQFEFERDEWEELLWHFDGDADALRIYTAESM